MKVYITATSGYNTYPTICGLHEFESLEKAIDFARFGAKELGCKYDELILIFNTKDYICYQNADVAIEIYDDYRE